MKYFKRARGKWGRAPAAPEIREAQKEPTPSDADRTKRVTEDFALWRAEAWAAYAQVRAELHRAKARLPRDAEASTTEVAVVDEDLGDALAAMMPPSGRAGRRLGPIDRLKSYYSGSDISKSWAAIFRAGESLFAVYESAELHAQTTRLENLTAALPDSQSPGKTLAAAREALQSGEESGPKERNARAMLRQVYRTATGITETLQTEARVLRNTLLVSSCALLIAVVALGVVGLLGPDVISLCAPTGSEMAVCPTGTDTGRFDIFAIEMAGALGGVLSIVIPLATGDRIKTPYRVFNHQLLLKILAGASAGLAGVIFIQSDFTSALTAKTGTTLFAYAVFFGFSQQALTGLIDRKANKLGEETPTAKSV